MLSFSRTNLVRLTHIRGLSLVATNHRSPVAQPPLSFSLNRNQDSNVPSKQQLDQKKNHDITKNDTPQTLHDFVDFIEWRGAINISTLNKVSQLLWESSKNSLTDRQLSVLISAYGSTCDSVGKTKRTTLLNQTLQKLEEIGVSFGPLAKNAVLSARIDNREHINVINELKDWESVGLNPDENTYSVNVTAPGLMRPHFNLVDELLKALYQKDFVTFCDVIKTNGWPNYKQFGGDVFSVLEFIVSNSNDVEDAKALLQDFATSNCQFRMCDSISLLLITRALKDNGVKNAIDIMSTMRNIFPARNPTRRYHVKKAIEVLYNTLCSTHMLKDQQILYEALLDKNYVTRPNSFIHAVIEAMINQGYSFSSLFKSWRNLSVRYGTAYGFHILLEECMTKVTDKKEQAKRVGQLLRHWEIYDDPYKSVAEVICVAIKIGHFDTAKKILNKVSISARNFMSPLFRWRHTTGNLLHVEQLASLVSTHMYAEKRGKRKKVAKTNASDEIESLDPDLLETVNRFCGVRNGKFESDQKRGKKAYRDDEALHNLSKLIQSVWVEKAVESNNLESVKLLLEWSSENNVSVDEHIIQKIENFKQLVKHENIEDVESF